MAGTFAARVPDDVVAMLIAAAVTFLFTFPARMIAAWGAEQAPVTHPRGMRSIRTPQHSLPESRRQVAVLTTADYAEWREIERQQAQDDDLYAQWDADEGEWEEMES